MSIEGAARRLPPIPPQCALPRFVGRVPAALLEGAEAALAALDTDVQDALTLAVLRGAGCEVFIEGAEIVLRGPTEDVHGLLADHAEALGRALLRERGEALSRPLDPRLGGELDLRDVV